MEFAVAITGLLCLSLFIGPIVYFHNSGKKLKKQVINSFINRAGELSLTINEFEYWNRNVLGVDAGQKKLLFLHNEHNNVRESFIDLNNIIKCTVRKQSKDIKSAEGNYKSLDKVLLELTGRNTNSPQYITFYDSVKSNQLVNELQLAEKWAKIITNSIS